MRGRDGLEAEAGEVGGGEVGGQVRVGHGLLNRAVAQVPLQCGEVAASHDVVAKV